MVEQNETPTFMSCYENIAVFLSFYVKHKLNLKQIA